MQKIFKKIVIVLIVVLILFGAFYQLVLFPNKKDNYGCLYNKEYSWCDFKEKCIKKGEEDCNLTQEWVLDEAKKIIGLDLNIMPNEKIQWNKKDGQMVFSARGIYYLDVLGAEKILKWFENWDYFLKETGFKTDSYNPAVTSEKETIINYIVGKIVCVLKRTDNSSNTSSLSLLCGNIDDELCNFNSACGKECKNDDDCGLTTNGCAKRIVCRNKNYKFYDDCLDPTSNLDELDISIVECVCLNNQCVPKNEKYRSKN